MQLRLVSKDPNDPNNIIYLKSTEFFLQELLGKKKCTHVERIFIKVDAFMGSWGECFVRNLKNGNITVRIKFKRNLNFIETLSTIAHECVHTKQFITGQLTIDKKNNFIWKNKNYGKTPYAGLTEDEIYSKLPWEKEANAKERELAFQYVKHYFTIGH